MIGPLEIVIIVVVLLLIFGYRKLPALGRSAGEGARELKGSVQEMVGDKADPKTLGKSAGRGLREAREFRDALTGKSQAATTEPATTAEREREQAPAGPEPTGETPDSAEPEPEPATEAAPEPAERAARDQRDD